MSYEDSIDPRIHDLERDAIFRRAWLMVGRVEELPRLGSYFTKAIDVVGSSVLVVRSSEGQVRAFHNLCRHRGNMLVWQEDPTAEVHGTCRQFTCKYHGWHYDLEGQLTFVQQEEEFFDVGASELGLAPVNCDVWLGFVFVNFADQPEQTLAEFLGPLGARLVDYPMHRLTSRFSYRSEIKANWKLYMDAFQEFYHAPVLHASQSPDAMAHASREAGFEGAHYELIGPHRMVTTSGFRSWQLPDHMLKPMERITRSGLFGPWQAVDLEIPEGLNPPKIEPWGLDSFQFFPNFALLTWSQGWVVTYQYWPTSFNSHVFEGNLFFMPATTARERVAQEMAAVTFKEYALQDSSTLEATQSMLESRAVSRFPLNDQEVLCRHLHKVTNEWVRAFQEEAGAVSV